MCGYKVKRGERGEEGSKEGEREGKRSGHPTRFLPFLLSLPTVQGTQALGQSWQVLFSGRADQEDRTQDACRAL